MPPAKIPARSTARYELKAVVGNDALSSVLMWIRLHDACFRVRFPLRCVNTLYFDTPNLDNFGDNLSGFSQRHKVRLRWYGTSLENVQVLFEVKFRQNRYGWKLSQKIDQPLAFEQLTWTGLSAVLHRELALELRSYFFQEREPVLLVRYQREYYETFDGRIRITVDHHLEAYDQRTCGLLTLRYPLPKSDLVIVEFKGGRENCEALAAVVASVPFRIGRSSKYADSLAEILGY